MKIFNFLTHESILKDRRENAHMLFHFSIPMICVCGNHDVGQRYINIYVAVPWYFINLKLSNILREFIDIEKVEVCGVQEEYFVFYIFLNKFMHKNIDMALAQV